MHDLSQLCVEESLVCVYPPEPAVGVGGEPGPGLQCYNVIIQLSPTILQHNAPAHQTHLLCKALALAIHM